MHCGLFQICSMKAEASIPALRNPGKRNRLNRLALLATILWVFETLLIVRRPGPDRRLQIFLHILDGG